MHPSSMGNLGKNSPALGAEPPRGGVPEGHQLPPWPVWPQPRGRALRTAANGGGKITAAEPALPNYITFPDRIIAPFPRDLIRISHP